MCHWRHRSRSQPSAVQASKGAGGLRAGAPSCLWAALWAAVSFHMPGAPSSALMQARLQPGFGHVCEFQCCLGGVRPDRLADEARAGCNVGHAGGTIPLRCSLVSAWTIQSMHATDTRSTGGAVGQGSARQWCQVAGQLSTSCVQLAARSAGEIRGDAADMALHS